MAAKGCADLLRDMVSNKDLLVVQQHTIDGLDSRLGGFSAVIVDEPIALRAPTFVCCDLARENVTESSEGVVKSLGQEVMINGWH